MTNATSSKESARVDRLAAALLKEPSTQDDLLELLRADERKDIMHREALDVIQRSLIVTHMLMHVRKIMVPRANVVDIDLDQSPEDFLPFIVGPAIRAFRLSAMVRMTSRHPFCRGSAAIGIAPAAPQDLHA